MNFNYESIMKIISTNISRPKTVLWKTVKVTTGIYKEPTNLPIFLAKEDVRDDHVNDRNVHGGIDKACYLFSVDYYGYWKQEYPDLDWQYGMFGENLTIEGMNEETIHLGDIYKLGEAVVRVAQPRQPCFKLGIKFQDQSVLKKFIQHNHPGFYVHVLHEGNVKPGDILILTKKAKIPVSISAVFNLFYQKEKDRSLMKKVLAIKDIPKSLRRDIQG